MCVDCWRCTLCGRTPDIVIELFLLRLCAVALCFLCRVDARSAVDVQRGEVNCVPMVSEAPSPEATTAEEEPSLAAAFAVAAAPFNVAVALLCRRSSGVVSGKAAYDVPAGSKDQNVVEACSCAASVMAWGGAW